MTGLSWETPQKTVLRLNLGQGWTWQFFDMLIDRAFAMIRDTPHNVDLVIHDEEPGYQVPHGSPLSHFRRAAESLPPNTSFVCIVAGDKFTRAMISLLSSFNRNVRDKVRVVSTFEEAQNLIAQRHSFFD